MARYGQVFKDRAVARLLAPESAALEVVSREVGVGCATLQRWVDDARSTPARGRAWSAGARLDAVIVTAAMAESGKVGQERLVPRAKPVSGRAEQMARQCHGGVGRARAGACQPAGHAPQRYR